MNQAGQVRFANGSVLYHGVAPHYVWPTQEQLAIAQRGFLMQTRSARSRGAHPELHQLLQGLSPGWDLRLPDPDPNADEELAKLAALFREPAFVHKSGEEPASDSISIHVAVPSIDLHYSTVLVANEGSWLRVIDIIRCVRGILRKELSRKPPTRIIDAYPMSFRGLTSYRDETGALCYRARLDRL